MRPIQESQKVLGGTRIMRRVGGRKRHSANRGRILSSPIGAFLSRIPLNRPKSVAGRSPARGAGSLRIIGGEWKRRLLPIVDAEGLRPTPDRVRETVFNWLAHAFGGDFGDLRVLDLFAGTGALGIEAASRGAASVMLVEKNADAARGLRAARASLGATRIDIREADALAIARELQRAEQQFDLVFLDPPFSHQWIDTALPLAVQLSSPGGYIYVESERPIAESTLAPLDLEMYRADKAGEVFYHLLRRNKKER